tara:strand:- start:78 stop:824 length:747 start_codon:yes stop_codon:yes gene_type:complete
MNRFNSFGNMNSGRGGILSTMLKALVLLFIIYLIVNWYFKKSKKLISMSSGTIAHSISADDLPENTQAGNYTYSMWFYIHDWNKKYGQPKTILQRGEDDDESLKVSLGETENNITVKIKHFGVDDTPSQPPHETTVQNIPLQKWVNLTISTFGKSLDIYLNGKLYKTDVLPNLPKPDIEGTPVLITPDGGFSGWTTNFLYTPSPTNPQQAYNIYKKGYGGSMLGNLFNKYRLRVQVLSDNEVTGGFEL